MSENLFLIILLNSNYNEKFMFIILFFVYRIFKSHSKASKKAGEKFLACNGIS